MRLSRRQIEKARSADLPKFVEENFPDRIMKSGKSWRDAKYRDLTIWQDVATVVLQTKGEADLQIILAS